MPNIAQYFLQKVKQGGIGQPKTMLGGLINRVAAQRPQQQPTHTQMPTHQPPVMPPMQQGWQPQSAGFYPQFNPQDFGGLFEMMQGDNPFKIRQPYGMGRSRNPFQRTPFGGAW